MIFVDLTWYQRMVLWSRIGSSPVPSLKEASVHLRIIEKLRPTDEEQRETQMIAVPGGYSWRPPAPGWGDRSIELEDEEAKVIADSLNTPQPGQALIARDSEWMFPLVAKIEAQLPVKEARELAAV